MRIRVCASLCLLACLTGAASASDIATTWDVARTSAPKDLAELKALQSTVKTMVDKVTPATVAVFYVAGAGSGVIVSEDGLVLTAAHVVTPMPFGLGGGRGPRTDAPYPNRVRLQLSNGSSVQGVVLGRNSRMDSAMVKITSPVPEKADWPGASEGKWPMVELGNSSVLQKGQWVVSLGHPGGPKQERRPPVRLGQMVNVTKDGRRISSDCTLVGGDSGGPLFDLDGKLLGIHSSIGANLDNNFHIPTHAFQNEWKRLLRGDIIGNMTTTGWLGVVLAGEEENNTRGTQKPLIEDVRRGSPADEVGLLPGDLILEFKGEPVESSLDIDQMLNGMKPGEKILVKVQRGRETYEFEITLGRRPSNN